MKEDILYSDRKISRSRRCSTTHRAHAEAPGSVKREREWEKSVGNSLYCGFHGKGWVKQGKHT